MRTVTRSIDFEKEMIVQQDELDGDLEFTTVIGFGSKSLRS
jgi:hypothetical protein